MRQPVFVWQLVQLLTTMAAIGQARQLDRCEVAKILVKNRIPEVQINDCKIFKTFTYICLWMCT